MNSIRLNQKDFLKNLESIATFIKFIEEEKELFKKVDPNNTEMLGVNIDKMQQRFNELSSTPVTYNAVIISLYGCFEAYIDKITSAFLDFLISKVKCYNDLPENIKNKHIRKSGEFLSNPQRFRNFEVTEQDVINNLHMCLEAQENFLLNKELLLIHGGNLGIDQLIELFNDLGLEQCKGRILSNMRYIKYISEKHQLNLDRAKSYINKKNQELKEIGLKDVLFEELTQLVEQRNKVAHGWNVDSRLSFNVLIEQIIPFMKMLGCVIGDIFEEEIIKTLKSADLLTPFDLVIDVYKNRILCVNCKKAKLKRGDYIYGYNGKKYVALNILELQHNNQPITDLCEENIDVGILVDSDIKKNWEFYYT